MALRVFPSSYRCDCGHESHFSDSTIRELEQKSRQKRRLLLDSAEEEHGIEFELGRAAVGICPRLGRCKITGIA